jgi:hypothetical protein
MRDNDPIYAIDSRDVFDLSESSGADLQSALERGWTSETASSPSTGGISVPGWSSLSVGALSRPLLGCLPLARIVPQDVHSVMDYVDAAGVLSGAFITSCPKAKAASWIIGGGGLAAAALTDYRLSLAKVVPIEAHETIDYAFGISAIAAPFVFGYRKTAPLVAALHVAIGIGTIVASLFTDYRAYRGVGRR